MAVTLKEISKWLDTDNTNHHADEDRIVMIYADDNNSYGMTINASEEGEMFYATMRLLNEDKSYLTIKDHPHTGLILQHVLFKNYETKFGTWEFDPSVGDIRLTVEIPLEDALMTEKQFNRIKQFMYRDGSSHAEEIRHIMKTEIGRAHV